MKHPDQEKKVSIFKMQKKVKILFSFCYAAFSCHSLYISIISEISKLFFFILHMEETFLRESLQILRLSLIVKGYPTEMFYRHPSSFSLLMS